VDAAEFRLRLPQELATERLLLRRWTSADRETFAALNADPRVAEHLPGPLSRSESDALAARIEAHFEEHGFGLWAVEVPGVAPFAGFVGLSVPAFQSHFTPCVEIGWRLAARHWGRGYASEAAHAALAFGFGRLGLGEVVSFTVPGNARSRRVMERIGMRHDPKDDFDHPAFPDGHRLRRHVLYRIGRSGAPRRTDSDRIRPASAGDLPFLREMLFEAAFWREGSPRPALEEGLARPDLSRLMAGWGRAGDAAVVAEIDAIGRVRWVVGPNKVHHLFIGDWARTYPSAELCAAPGLAEKRRDLRFQRVLDGAPVPDWGDQVLHHLFAGAPRLNEVAFLHPHSRTLLLTDLAFNVRPGPGSRAPILHWLLGATGRFGPHRLVRSMIRDRAAARASLAAILAWDFDRVIVTHGEVLERGGPAAMRSGFAWLGAV
jgi:ribosomal-protein-alanine N-acetyltransferase